MRTRIISAIVAIGLAIPIFIYGGLLFNITFYLLTLLGLREFLKVREKEKNFPDFIRLISYMLITFLYFANTLKKGNMSFSIDYRVIAGLFLTLLLPVVLYHDPKEYNVKDAFYAVGGVFFLGCSMSLFAFYRNIGLGLIIFLFLITIITDLKINFFQKYLQIKLGKVL